jgi:hypothetical protein
MSPSNRKRLVLYLGTALLAALIVPLTPRTSVAEAATNGVLTIYWDANSEPDLAGYRAYIATSAAVFSLPPAQARLQATTRDVPPGTLQNTFTSLDTTRVYWFGVTAFDTSGNESGFSNVISAQAAVTPTLTSVAPLSGTQGDTGLTVQVLGSNFQTGSTVSFGPGITVTNLNTTSAPFRLIATLNIASLAEVDFRDVTVTNAVGGSSTRTNAFSVNLDLGRADINGSNRIDGGDLVRLATSFASTSGGSGYSTSVDLNVDGVVDGTDLSYLITFFGFLGPF